MKIKKSASSSPAAAPAGGAAIAARFQLDPVAASSGASAKNGTISKNAALCALIAGGICLALVGILTFTLYKHWEYLMPA